MIAAWRQTNVRASTEERMSKAFSEAAMSITITSLTDALAFGIGAISPFESVRIFCCYAGLAVVFAYLYQITYFAACMVITGYREANNFHSFLFWHKVEPKSELQSPSYNIFCAGGLPPSSPDAGAGGLPPSSPDAGASGSSPSSPDSEEIVTDHFIMSFFKKYYGPFLTNTIVLILIVLLYVAYLGLAVWGVFGLEYGLVLTKLLPDDSYAVPYFEKEAQYFTHYGPVISVVVDEEINYWEKCSQRKLEETLMKFEEDGDFFHDDEMTTSWLRDYKIFLKSSNLTAATEEQFYYILKETFLQDPLFRRYIPDIVFKSGSPPILSSRSYITSKDVGNSAREVQVMQKARSIAKESDISQIAFHPAFTFYDQYTAIIPNTIQNLGIAMGAMFVISLIMIPIGSPIVALAIASILIGVIGYMSWWNIALDTISMINLILCIGFSVDFCAHITYVFFAINQLNSKQRTIHALYTLGMPILQGACSTILGVVALSTSNSYIFRTFFKTMFLVISFGALHGLVFLPAFLTIMGSFYEKSKSNSVVTDTTCPEKRNQISNENGFQEFVYQNAAFDGNPNEIGIQEFAHEHDENLRFRGNSGRNIYLPKAHIGQHTTKDSHH